MKFNVDYLRWLAKLNYASEEDYGAREIVEIGKVLTSSVAGVHCAWVHPRIPPRYGGRGQLFRPLC